MRLICPECAAQYEIADGLIPPDGRDVECSSCGHGWRQSGLPPLRLSPDAAVADDSGAGTADVPPRVSRGLTDPVLAILREEAERELSARAAVRAGRSGPAAADPDDEAGDDDAQDEGPPARRSDIQGTDDGDGLPDPHVLAASLEWEVPAREPAEVIPPKLPAAVPPPRLPALTESQQQAVAQRSHNLGFAVAMLIAALLAGAYAAAPSLADRGKAGVQVMEAREGADRGRLWLQAKAGALTDSVTAGLKALFD